MSSLVGHEAAQPIEPRAIGQRLAERRLAQADLAYPHLIEREQLARVAVAVLVQVARDDATSRVHVFPPLFLATA